MTPEEDLVHLQNIAQCIMEIEGYNNRQSYEEFVANEEDKAAVMENLTQIGQAARLLSDDFKNQYDEIDFRVLEGLSNAEYNDEMEMDHHAIFHIIGKDLPFIKDKIFDAKTQLENQIDIREGNTL
jgi:uncharacterized protein with HEPN domain